MKANTKNAFTAASALFLLGVAPCIAAETFDDAIKNATTSGQFRTAYILLNPDVAGAKTTSAAAFGGRLKFETAQWNNLQFAIAPYFSQKLDALSGKKVDGKQNGDLFDSNSESFAYLGEAYVNYAFSHGAVRFGRQQIDTPFINGDDIRMLPNTFSAAWLNMDVNKALSLQAGVVSEWAGFDSGGSQDKFKKAGNDGVSAIGASYAMNDNTAFQAWYYDFKDQYRQYYLDATYENGNVKGALQYSKYNEVKNSGTAGNVWGVKASYDIGAVSVGVGVNRSSNGANKSASMGLGGGNYFTSMDEVTIGGLTDAVARAVFVDYAVSDKFSVSLASAHFEDKNKTTTDTTEHNIGLAYGFNDKLDISFVHAMHDNKAAPSDEATNFSRDIARVNYTF